MGAVVREVFFQGDVNLLLSHLENVLVGQKHIVELSLATFFAGGHLLLEGPPGVGKTTLARSFSRLMDGSFHRIQMTTDLLPGEILGILRPNIEGRDFEFRPGPLFANVVLADELNRTSPKTQAALFEAMAEGTVSMDGKTYLLPRPFFVVATQNPIEHHGVFPLAESQLDRFMMQVSLSLPERNFELEIYREMVRKKEKREVAYSQGESSEKLQPLLSVARILEIKEIVNRIYVEDSVLEYAISIVLNTRKHPEIGFGVSVRGGIQYLNAARALALVRGRDFLTPKDVMDCAEPVLAHRLRLVNGESDFQAKAKLIKEIIEQTEVPR